MSIKASHPFCINTLPLLNHPTTHAPQNPYDVLLAELIFTTEDVREVIYTRLEECDEGFVQFLEGRIQASTDIDERGALRSLIEMVAGVKAAVERKMVGGFCVGSWIGLSCWVCRRTGLKYCAVCRQQPALTPPPSLFGPKPRPATPQAEDAARLQEEKKRQLEEEARLLAEMAEAKKQAASAGEEARRKEAQREEMLRLQGTEAAASGAGGLDPTGGAAFADAQQSYEQLLLAFLGLDYGDAAYVRQVVEANYERCTLEFLDLLGARLAAAETPAADRAKLTALSGHIEAILQERMSRAAARLGSVVKAGTLDQMVDKVYELVGRGEVDEPFLLLLETNVQEAERAGAAPAAEVFRKLIATAREAIDEKLTPATRLIRRLLRVEDVEKRKEILNEAFRPKATALAADGTKTDVQPDVPPPDFIEELRQLIKNFGNIDANNFNAKLLALVEEAEEVSTAIYGKAMSHREQQDYMWNKASISVFDLEALESKAEKLGDQMPWQNDKYDTMLPPGFDENGMRTIGGGRKSEF